MSAPNHWLPSFYGNVRQTAREDSAQGFPVRPRPSRPDLQRRGLFGEEMPVEAFANAT